MGKLFLIDAIGPFFKGYQKRRINWSKIPFGHLQTVGEAADRQWQSIEEESSRFAKRVTALGYNAVTLDDLAHLSSHPGFEWSVRERNRQLAERMARVIAVHRNEDLQVYVTSDVLTTSVAIEEQFGDSREALEDWYGEVIVRFFKDFPDVSGLILRIGESDGLDVSDVIRSRLHIRTAGEARALLLKLLPLFEHLGKKLILRTWTVGAHPIGDLIWHRDRVAQMTRALRSSALILSFKHGDSDFFRYLPLSEVLAQTDLPKIIEFQGRREYEGAGEYPSFIGWDCERFARELVGDENLVGFSMWCQTGGWHGFRRRPFVHPQSNDEGIWIELNCVAAIAVFRDEVSASEAITRYLGERRALPALSLLEGADRVIHQLLYIPGFAEQQLYFRRVRVPPLFHVYWDCLFCTASVRKLVRCFVSDHEAARQQAVEVLPLFVEMKENARLAELPVEDVVFMEDTFRLVALAREYYFSPWNQETVAAIKRAKKNYKARWPRSERSRYRVKTDFEPFRLKRRNIELASRFLLRDQRRYRIRDHLVILGGVSLVYRLFGKRGERALPKFVRKSAMGIESVMR